DACVESLFTLRKTFEVWFYKIAPGYAALRVHAERLNYRRAFLDLQEQYGLIIGHDQDGKPRLLQKAEVSHMFDVSERLPEVEEWRKGLTAKQRWDWQSPSSIKRHCPIFGRAPGDKNEKQLTPAEKDRQALAAALEELEQLKKHKADERWTPTE